MPLVSGRTGVFRVGSTTYPITRWSATLEVVVDKAGTSASAGWKTGVVGTRDARGSCTIWPAAVTEEIAEGTTGTFELEHEDYDGTGVRRWSFSGVIKSITKEVDVDNGNAVALQCEFEALGAVTKTST